MKKRKKAGQQNLSERDHRSLWQAVQARDRRADGAFVYAVESTGVYCRPSCPSRRPRAANVRFFPLPAAAEQAGFRPCRRCKPSNTSVPDSKLDAVAKVCGLIDARLLSESAGAGGDERLTLSALSAAAKLSPHQLERAFRKAMGITPRQYADARRMRRLKSRLKEGNDVTTALYDAGFGSSSRLYERAPSQMGMTPAEYGRGGAGMTIRYAISDSPLGRLLVGATERGISALYLGDTDEVLRAALRDEYPRADIVSDRDGHAAPAQLTTWIARILDHLRGREPHLDLPTDVRATAFTRRVWQELRKIPYGESRTYTEVARAIGKPSAIRAVARACATNPTAVVVPCHRVVRKNGDLAGYRWGIAVKQELLRKESEIAATAKRKP
ncbi:MAG: bifunctional DNA-binding transcriptional regulator/O6-methylguanine-DNA methyltransferase Ada [Candidatus Acidiferrales bacterium]